MYLTHLSQSNIFPCLLNIYDAFFSKQYFDAIGPFSYMSPHIYIMYMYIVTHAGSSTKLLIIVLVILAVTVTTLFLAIIILTVVLVLKKSTHRRLKNPVETRKHPRDEYESGLDERGMYFYCVQ